MKKNRSADGVYNEQCQHIDYSYYFERRCGIRFSYADIENLLSKQKESGKKQIAILLGCGCYEKRAIILNYLNLFCTFCKQTTRHKNNVSILQRLTHEQCYRNSILQQFKLKHTFPIQQFKSIKIPKFDKIQPKQQHCEGFDDFEQIKVILSEIQEKDEQFNVPKMQRLDIRNDKDEIYMECYYCHSIIKGEDINKLINFQWKSIFPQLACLICIHSIKITKDHKEQQQQKKASSKDMRKKQSEHQLAQINPIFDHHLSQKSSPLQKNMKQEPLYSTKIKQSKFMKGISDYLTNPKFTLAGKGLPQPHSSIYHGRF